MSVKKAVKTAVKKAVKKALKVDPLRKVSPVKNLVHFGSRLHGYKVPEGYLNGNSVVYCVGAGTDISFDVEIAVKCGSQVHIFDPMPYALKHFEEVKRRTASGEKFVIDRGEWAYEYKASNGCFSHMFFHSIGVWSEKKKVKFYEPARENYAGHSIVNLQKTRSYVEAQVDRLSDIMKSLNHPEIDLLKIEIEGAEYEVIQTILEDKPAIKIICVEFDEVYHSKSFNYLFNIKSATDKLLALGYKMVHSTEKFKRTFVRNDVYRQLKEQK